MTPSLSLWEDIYDRLLIQPWGAVVFLCSVHCHHDWGISADMSQTGSQIPACITAGGSSFPAAGLDICLVEFCQVPVVLFLQPGSLWMAACLLLCQNCSPKSRVVCKIDVVTACFRSLIMVLNRTHLLVCPSRLWCPNM